MTSYLFPDAAFSLERLKAVSSAVGKDRLVVDVRYMGCNRHSLGRRLTHLRRIAAGEERISGLSL